ncbi:hypothetical protein [Roseibacillus ishigakijimensis]|uniref:Uncharacterized protein n=1 Tax=Roseibacillus ishigakijimensis TaxID=454146 RepID=A0A934VNF7_9BACT|nr:hypothetical protein [Roseibacillus ishigakijimensis]MBK1834995.1 hypothetical protein [Roseibacillus ishigakijimensis]
MSRHTCRILFSEKNSSRAALDANTGQRPYWVRGDDLEIEFALERQDGSFLTASDIGNIELVVRAANDDEAEPKRMVLNLDSGDCDGGFTASDWRTGGSLAVASWDAADAALEVPDSKASQLYFIYAIHTDGDGDKTTFGSYVIEVRKGPHAAPTLAAPDPYPPNYIILSETGQLTVGHEFFPNSGEQLLAWIPMNENADANTFHGFTFRVGTTDLMRMRGKSDNSGNITNASVEVHALELTEEGDQEATAFSLGYNARKIASFDADGETVWTLPKGVLITRIVLIQSGGIGLDNIAVDGLSITAKVSGKRLVNSYELRRGAKDILLPDSAFPIDDSNGETLEVSASSWNDAGVDVYVYYEYLPEPS